MGPHLSALLAIGAFGVAKANVFPRQTSFANSSAVVDPTSGVASASTSTAESSSVTIPATLSSAAPCVGVPGICYDCGLIADGIELNSWWTSAYNLTVATVSVNYIQYKNTLLAANSSTYLVPNATNIYGTYQAHLPLKNVPGLPTDIVDGNLAAQKYGRSIIEPATAFNLDNITTIQSPAAWINMFSQGVITLGWTEYSDGVSVTNAVSPGLGLGLETKVFAIATDEHPIYSGAVRTGVPEAWSTIIIDAVKTIPGTNWSLASCSGDWEMSGEPTVTSDGVYGDIITSDTSTSTGETSTKRPTSTEQPGNTRTTTSNVELPSETDRNDQKGEEDEGDKPAPDTSDRSRSPEATPTEVTPQPAGSDDEPTSTDRSTSSPAKGDQSNSDEQMGDDGSQRSPEKTSTGGAEPPRESGDVPIIPQTGNDDANEQSGATGSDESSKQNAGSSPQGDDDGSSPGSDSDNGGASGNDESSAINDGSSPHADKDGSSAGGDNDNGGASGSDESSTESSDLSSTNPDKAQQPGDDKNATPASGETDATAAGNNAHITPTSDGAFILPNGEVLSKGSSSVVGETTFAVSPSEGMLINGEPASSQLAAGPVAIPGATSQAVSGFLIGGNTMLPGDSLTISGTTYTLPPGGSSILINNVATTLENIDATSKIVIGNIDAAPTAVEEYVLPGTTLLPGVAATVVDTVYSFPASGSGLVINGATMTNLAAFASGTQPSVRLSTISGKEAYVIADQTLSSGNTFIMHSTTFVIASDGKATLATPNGAMHTDDIASVIMAAIGGLTTTSFGDDNSPTSTPTLKTSITNITSDHDSGVSGSHDAAGESEASAEGEGHASKALVSSTLGFAGLLLSIFWL